MIDNPSPDAFLAVCPSRQVLARIGEKWTLLVLAALAEGPRRSGELHRRLEGVSRKVLTQTLRQLERDGLIQRCLLSSRPLHVEYRLSPLGTNLLPLVRDLKAWAERNFAAIALNRAAFDSAQLEGGLLKP